MFREFIRTRYPALLARHYRRFWLGSFASVGANQLIVLGQGWLIFELTGSALQLGWLGAAAALPNIMMTLIGGVIADRFDKRQIIIVTSALCAALLAVLALLDYTEAVQVWHVLAIAAAFSLVTGIDWPARVAIYPYLVERDALMSAVALNAFIWQSTRMAIPALGGVIIANSDTWVVFALASLGFAIMVAVVLTLPVQTAQKATHSPFQQLVQGLQFIARHQLFIWLLTGTFVGMFFGQSYVQVMPIFADHLGGDEQTYGLLLTIGGIGSIVGTLLVGGLHEHARLGFIILAGAMASALATVGFAAAAQAGLFWLAIMLAFLAASMASVFMITSMTVLQMAVPDDLRGRVMGIHSIGYSLVPLGGLFLGAFTDAYSALIAVGIGCSIYMAVIVLIGAGKPVIRQLGQTPLRVLE